MQKLKKIYIIQLSLLREYLTLLLLIVYLFQNLPNLLRKFSKSSYLIIFRLELTLFRILRGKLFTRFYSTNRGVYIMYIYGSINLESLPLHYSKNFPKYLWLFCLFVSFFFFVAHHFSIFRLFPSFSPFFLASW